MVAALTSAGADPDSAAPETTELGGWSIEWEGRCKGTPLWFTLYGHHASSSVEVRFNEWIFTPVRLDQVEELLSKALSGDAAMRRGAAGLGRWRLEFVVGDKVVVNTDREGSGDPDTEWEMTLRQNL
ncbi:hypothetical protein ACH4S8_03450 [Streptomyces sp. NPDC021080]|uniref:hypothetical protein n=1 Tax=Streptomyces sp. NPDC021080 TaxID=3365110 RepID=UPI003788777A